MARPPATNEELIRAEREIDEVRTLSERYGVPGIDLNQICLRTEDLELVPRAIAEHRLLLPVLVKDDRLFVAMRDPTDGKAIDELEFVTARKVLAYVAAPTALARVVPAAYDALGQGRQFYVGPTCPPEIQERMGVDDDPPPAPAEPVPASVKSPKLEEVAAKDDLSFNEFGSIEDDLSVVVQVDVPPSVGARRGTVLVVDDEADIRLLLRRVLESRGHHVIEADRGLEALRMVKAHMPDLLILDAMLPEVHGFEIARRIKGSKRYGHIPIVMVSAVYKGMRVAADVKDSYGVDAYVEKPFRMQQIVEAVEQALSKAALEGPPERKVAELADRSAEVAKLLDAGIESYRRGDVDTAIAQLREGLAIDPLAFRLRFHLGLLYGRKGLLFEGIAELEMAAQQNGKYFPCWKNLAVLYQKAGFRNKALEAWRKAKETAPDDDAKQAIDEHLRALS